MTSKIVPKNVKNREEKDKDWEFIVKMMIIMRGPDDRISPNRKKWASKKKH